MLVCNILITLRGIELYKSIRLLSGSLEMTQTGKFTVHYLLHGYVGLLVVKTLELSVIYLNLLRV